MTSRQRGPKPSESLIDPAHFHKCDYATTNSAAFADPQVVYAKTYKEKTMPEMQQDLRAKPLLTGTSYKADYDGRQGEPYVRAQGKSKSQLDFASSNERCLVSTHQELFKTYDRKRDVDDVQLMLPVQRFGDKGTFFTSHDILDHGHRRKPQTFDGYQDGVNYARNTRQFQPPRVGDSQVLNIITNSVTPAPQPGRIPVDTRPPFLRSLAALRPADP